MMGEVFKTTTVGLPMSLFRPESRGALWRAELEPDQQAAGSRLVAHGTSETSARRALSDVLTAAFARLDQGAVLVLGGGPGHANCLHLILPEPHAWVVWVVRDGHRVPPRVRWRHRNLGGTPAMPAPKKYNDELRER
ncbi:hypothetical protein, partial [Micromonospora sp. NPDC049102]|uniref:hypothetical protein n=1 Tax=Micromonospora sp. NPDC049102 TaxID=3364265 RepID=UPI003711F773